MLRVVTYCEENMPIDLNAETLITLADACKCKVFHKKPCIATLSRWSLRGVKCADGGRAYLETLLVGGCRMTSEAAILRMVEAQNRRDDTPSEPSPADIERRSRNADQALKDRGV
jgi:hypothetical protein